MNVLLINIPLVDIKNIIEIVIKIVFTKLIMAKVIYL